MSFAKNGLAMAMKRHPALEPFSRDHNDGLILARALEEGREGADSDARIAWDLELQDHFAEEERLLGPLCSAELSARLRAEHQDIERRIQALPADPKELGVLLDAHIRWEERELFPTIEAGASEAQLTELQRETNELEKRRWPMDARRSELVQRRWKAGP